MALGGAAGALARYGLGGWIHGMAGAAFPWGTFVVNGERLAAGAGEAFRMEPADRHDILNDSGEPLRLIFIKTPYLPEDKVNI